MVTSRFFIYALCVTAIFTSPLSSAQTATKDNADVRSELALMQALLTEVRQLRQDVKHMAVVNGRAQVTIQQMQLQEQRVTHASVQLDAVRKQIADVLSQHEQAAKNIERLEAAIPQEQDAKRAAEEEGALAAFKQSVERLTANEARLRAQEADATIVAQSEQAKWQDLTDRLSALNQSLDSGDSIIPGTQNKAK
jgi:hypothetical protein